METIEAAGRDVREAARRTEHAKGVFIYARYAVEKLNPQDTVSLDELRDFPDGITGFDDVQFNRLLGANYECIGNHSPMWRVVEAVMAAREPLHVEALDDLVECSAFERKSAVATLSMLFPVRDHRLHVFHKSVKDWLVNPERKEEMCYVGVQRVHETLGKRCHEVLREALGNDKEASEASTYALKHCIYHLCEGGRRQEARALMFRLEYLEERAKLGPAHALVLDGNRIRSGKKDKALELLHSAISWACKWVAIDGDRIVSGSKDKTIKIWTTEGECLQTLEGHSGWVKSVAIDGDRIVSGSDDRTLQVWK